MNNRFINILSIVASCALFAAGCSEDNSSFETPAAAGDTPSNDGIISQNNFTILFSEPTPKYYDPETGNFTSVTSDVTVQIGDNKNQLITGSRVIYFRTEWGLIDPSCTTEDGGCSVSWRSGSPDTMPADFKNTIIAYSHGGQESYADINGNGIFDDGDIFATSTYADLEEPFINVDESYSGSTSTFTAGDIIIDTINGLDLTGTNTEHDIGDGKFNGPNCAHSTLCSTTRTSITVWEDGTQLLNGGAIYSVGGTVTGLGPGTLVIQNNGADDLTINSNGTYVYYYTPGGLSYNITVKTQPATKTCTVSNESGFPTANVTDVDISCI